MTPTQESDNVRYCAYEGSLVGLQQWLPTEPFDYDWGRSNPVIGCNNIRCSGCGQRVTATPHSKYSRRYHCSCTEYVESKRTPLGGSPEEYRGLSTLTNPPPGTWACAGHPALPVPTMLDDVRISPEKFREIARVGFASPPFVPPESNGRAIWVSRLYWILPASLRSALGEAVSELLLDDDPQVAVGAMSFYYDQRTAEGNERLTAVARDHGARLAKIADPNYPGYTLEDKLLTALEFRGFRRDDRGELEDPEAHELLRKALRAGKNPNDMIYTFGRLEPEWLAANAAEILKSSPSLVKDMLYLLRKQPEERRRAAYHAIAALDPATRAVLYERIDAEFKGEERDQILAALGQHA
jgi:hypothetical protein